MPALTNKRHEIFCQELVCGKSFVDAARAAGYKDTRHLVSNTDKIRAKPEVIERLAELQKELEATYIKTREEILISLGRIIKVGADRDKINACKLAAQMQGFLEETININDGRTAEEHTDAELAQLLKNVDKAPKEPVETVEPVEPVETVEDIKKQALKVFNDMDMDMDTGLFDDI